MKESIGTEATRQEDLSKKTAFEATQLHAAFAIAGGNGSSPASPLEQWHALKYLEILYSEYAKGDQLALMKAIKTCAYHGLIMPQWIADSFIPAIDKVLNFESTSWDEVLGEPFPKNTQINARKKKERLKFKVFEEARNILMNDHTQPIDASLFEKTGKNFGIAKTLAEEYCREVEKITGSSLKQYKGMIIELSRGKRMPSHAVHIP